MQNYCHLEPPPQSLFSPSNTGKITASENVSNISIGTNIVDPYQTAPTGAV